jgi:hypothetical protein
MIVARWKTPNNDAYDFDLTLTKGTDNFAADCVSHNINVMEVDGSGEKHIGITMQKNNNKKITQAMVINNLI